MKIIKTVAELKSWREQQNLKIGFVPTMGALHEGHGDLIRKSKNQCDITVVSIFVNPTQFNSTTDFEKYPNTFEADRIFCEALGVDALFVPVAKEIYHDDYNYKLTEKKLSSILEGQYRPGHFDGVLTVVLKLFMLVRPNLAFFGEKDWQQLQLIKGMTEALFLPLTIVPVATKRESSGLAMSSRNQRLNAEEKSKAALIYKALTTAATAEEAENMLSKSNFKIDYVSELQGRRLAAVFLGEVRLIDNISVEEVQT
jgi:pantoate--beta-alanine ligase